MNSNSVRKDSSLFEPLLDPNLSHSERQNYEGSKIEEIKIQCYKNHNKEIYDSVQSLCQFQNENFCNQLEKQQNAEKLNSIVRKLSWRVLPFLCLIIALSHLDRMNLSFVALSMFSADVEINQKNYWLVAGAMYIGYSFFQIPNSFGVVKFGAPIWLGMQLLGWGAVNVGFAFVQSLLAFVLLRFLLGVLQAGYQTGLWYSATQFFPATHLNIPFAIIDVGEGVAQVCAPIITVGLLQLGGTLQLMGWQWVFSLEGIFTVIVGIAVMFALPKDLSNTNVITDKQRLFLQNQMSHLERTKSKRALADITDTTSSAFWMALSNSKVWHLSIVRFLKTISSEATMYWLPIIIRAMLKQDDDMTQEKKKMLQTLPVLLTSIPYVTAYLATLCNGFHSQRCQENRYHGGVPYLVSGASFIFFPFVQNICNYLGFDVLVGQILSFLFLIITVTGEKMSNPNLTCLVCGHSTQKDVHVALAINLTIGNFGGFVGNYGFKLFKQYTGHLQLAIVFLGATLVLAGILLLFIDEPIPVHKTPDHHKQTNHKTNNSIHI